MIASIIKRSMEIDDFFYTPPKNDDMQKYCTDNQDDIAKLKELKIEVTGGGNPNTVYLSENFKNNFSVKLFFQGRDNVVIIGKTIEDHCNLDMIAEFHANNTTLIIGDLSHWLVRLSVISCHDNQLIIWGRGSTSFGTSLTCQMPNKIVAVGDDCMFATNTWIRNTDMHGFYDLNTRKKINKEGNTIIQPHVWIGQDVAVLGDVMIGYGSIAGAQSLVKGNLSPCSIYAGTPSKKIREETTWERTSNDEISEETLDFLGMCKDIFEKKQTQQGNEVKNELLAYDH